MTTGSIPAQIRPANRGRRAGGYVLSKTMGFALAVGLSWLPVVTGLSNDVVEAARSQIGTTVLYDPSYQALEYPGGDVSPDRGVCTDVVIRALRAGAKLDLQKAIHEDMKAHFSKYPKNWGLKSTDRNIDHRRVPNMQAYFRRMGYSLPVTDRAADYRPGDLVTCLVPPHLPHIMVVSDKTNAEGVPLVIHNIGRGTREEDRLFEFKLTGHYRIEPDKPKKASP